MERSVPGVQRPLRVEEYDRKRAGALAGPIDLKQRGSPEWCWQTVERLKIVWPEIERDERRVRDIIDELTAYRAWEVVPPNDPYGSLSRLLEAEIGVPEPEVSERIAAASAERIRRAAGATTGETLPKHLHATDMQFAHQGSTRATVNGVSLRTQRKLDTLARNYPALFEQVRSGDLSVNAAWIAAGRDVRKVSIPLDDPEKAAAVLRRHFTPDQLAALRAAL